MKNLITAGLLTLSLLACKDREPDPDVLPAATQTGANTAGCLVDGKVLVFSNNFSSGISHSYENSTYSEIQNTNGFRLKLYMTSINTKDEGFQLIINSNEKLEVNKKYSIGNTNVADPYFPANNLFIVYNNEGYRTDDMNKADIMFTKINTVKNTKTFISGTFSGKLKSKSGKTITIKEGRFDKDFMLE